MNIDKNRILTSIISALIIAAIMGLFALNNKVNSTGQELTNTNKELTEVKADLNKLEDKLVREIDKLEQKKADKTMQEEIRSQVKDINIKLDKIINKL